MYYFLTIGVFVLSVVGYFTILYKLFRKNEDAAFYFFIFGGMLWFCTTLFIEIGIQYLYFDKVCRNYKVAEVGGCNKEGQCGIIYEDGTAGYAYLPVKGGYENICQWEQKNGL
jgi:hypothetical protein